MKSPTQVERAINSLLQVKTQNMTGTRKPKARSPEVKGSCEISPLERFNKGIIYLEEEVHTLEKFR